MQWGSSRGYCRLSTPTTGTNVNSFHVWCFQLLQLWPFRLMWEMGFLKSRCSHPLTSMTTSGTTLGSRGTWKRPRFKWISSPHGRSRPRRTGMSSSSSTVSSSWVSPAVDSLSLLVWCQCRDGQEKLTPTVDNDAVPGVARSRTRLRDWTELIR